MHPLLKDYYEQELRYLRELGGEFAEEFPKIAGRLGLSAFDCADPYVERLLEGFAFLAARVSLKVDSEFPRFTQHLLEMVYPHYLSPLPSMAVVQIRPNLKEGSLQTGFSIPSGEVLRSQIAKGEQTACTFRTAHEVVLWPLQIPEAEYYSHSSAVASLGINGHGDLKAGLRLRLQTTAGLKFKELKLDRLSFFLRGGAAAFALYEQLVGNALCVSVQSTNPADKWQVTIGASEIKRSGFSDDQALLPYTPRSFQGYRLLQEYFAFSERFLFVDVGGLAPAVARCQDMELDLVFQFNRVHKLLVDAVAPNHFNLFCTPAVNLFPKRADRIHLSNNETEYHLIPDRSRPLDFEVHSVTDVKGYGTGAEPRMAFFPFYQIKEKAYPSDRMAYYTLHRQQRRPSAKQRRVGSRSSYMGSEVSVAIVDSREPPFSSQLKQLQVETLCTNRDLPLQMPVGVGPSDFSLQSGAPVESITVVEGPTRPRPSQAQMETEWSLISHLALNYLSLVDTDESNGAEALRQLLQVYSDHGDSYFSRQIEGVLSIHSKPVVRRMGGLPNISFVRGLEITVAMDEPAFEGSGVFLFGAVLERFFTRYVSINSFTETVIRSTERGEIMRWTPTAGTRHIL